MLDENNELISTHISYKNIADLSYSNLEIRKNNYIHYSHTNRFSCQVICSKGNSLMKLKGNEKPFTKAQISKKWRFMRKAYQIVSIQHDV